MNKIPKGYRLVVEEYPLPETRAERLTTVEAVLTSGGVQKLSLELGKGIKVQRLVKDALADVPSPPQDLLDDDLMSAIRNVEMEDMNLEGITSTLEALTQAFNIVSGKRFVPNTVAVHTKEELRAWLDLKSVGNYLFNVPIMEHKEVPEGSLALIASSEEDVEEIAFSLRVEMYPFKKKKGKS